MLNKRKNSAKLAEFKLVDFAPEEAVCFRCLHCELKLEEFGGKLTDKIFSFFQSEFFAHFLKL